MYKRGRACSLVELQARFHQSYARYVSKLASLCLLHKLANFDTYAVVSAITHQHLPEKRTLPPLRFDDPKKHSAQSRLSIRHPQISLEIEADDLNMILSCHHRF